MSGETVSERLHIGFFGCRNAGKSSLVNAVTSQETAVVSSVAGTTTDPVIKTMELLPLGPVAIIDTPGLDDVGALGEKRVARTKKILEKTDIAVLVCDARQGLTDTDKDLVDIFSQDKIPYIIAYNKADLCEKTVPEKDNEIYVSALYGTNIHELKEKIGHIIKPTERAGIVDDLVKTGDTVVLVTPIDEAAPKGRIILPQQNVLRGILDKKAASLVLQPEALSEALRIMKEPPSLVITDSQAFGRVAGIVPENVPLTSFSILMARYKGFLEEAVRGVRAIAELSDNDCVLIAEGCTHHRQCKDIGTVLLPQLIRKFTGKSIEFDFTSGNEFKDNLSPYSVVVHCGGCMITEKAVSARLKRARAANVPFTNYGTVLAYINGILERSLCPFPNILSILK